MIISAITVDPILSKLVILSLIIIAVGLGLYLLKQPSVITYIIVGMEIHLKELIGNWRISVIGTLIQRKKMNYNQSSYAVSQSILDSSDAKNSR